MHPFKRILATTDFSDPSIVALDHAERLAEALQAELIVLHVIVNLPPRELDLASRERIMIDRRQTSRNSLTELLSNSTRSVERRIAVAAGDPAEEILLVGDDEAVDLIVMASHGRSALGRLVLGSVAESVLEKSSRPLLIVPFGKRK